MEKSVTGLDDDWMFGKQLTQADITTAVAWRFINHAAAAIAAVVQRPALAEFCSRAEELPEFMACPLE